MYHLLALEQLGLEVGLPPFVDAHGLPQTEEKTCSPTEDPHRVATRHGDLPQDEDPDHLLRGAGLAVHLTRKDFATSPPSRVDAPRNENDDFLQNGAEMHEIDRLLETVQEEVKATDRGQEVHHVEDRMIRG